MKKILYLPLLLALLACTDSDTSREPTEEPAATRLQLEDWRGQWLVINYWARWCNPCIAEIPELNALDQNHDNVTVFGVNYDGATGADLNEQVTTLGVEFPTLEEDPAAQLGIPRPIVLPTTLVVDPDGILNATLVGPQTLESLEQATLHTSEGP